MGNRWGNSGRLFFWAPKSYYCYPVKENVVTKLAFATEIIYQNAEKNTKRPQRRRRQEATSEN